MDQPCRAGGLGFGVRIRATGLAAPALLVAAGLVASRPSRACTIFRLRGPGRVLVAKNYDWHTTDALVVANPRGLVKEALLLPGSRDEPLTWTARYANVTFDQYGRELPIGGMNERGLVVEVLWLQRAAFPPGPKRPAVTELQLVQFLLDTTATTAEAVRAASAVRVVPTYAKVHYFVCDPSGTCAVLDFLSSGLQVTSGRSLVPPVLTNGVWRGDAAAWRARRTSSVLPARDTSSRARFLRAAAALAAGPATPRRAWAILDSVAVAGWTKWQILYDLSARTISVRLPPRKTTIQIPVAAHTASCPTPARAWDLTSRAAAKRPTWRPWTPRANQVLLARTLPKVVPRPMVAALIRLLTQWASKGVCGRTRP